MSIKSFLQRHGWLQPFDAVDVDKAEVENADVERSKILQRFEASSAQLKRTQGKLRASIKEARTSTESAQRTNQDALADLVRDMRSSGQ